MSFSIFNDDTMYSSLTVQKIINDKFSKIFSLHHNDFNAAQAKIIWLVEVGAVNVDNLMVCQKIGVLIV